MENDVTQVSSPAVEENVTPVEAPKGSKTPEANLYAALEEERKLRKEAEQKARELETKVTVEPETEIFSDEGKVLQNKLGQLEAELSRLQEERDLERLTNTYPALKDKSAEFENYRKDYPRHKLDNVAKLFLSENDLLQDSPVRKGLEKPVAGPKTPPSSGMTTEDVANLRKTNYNKYMELITSGKLRPEDIK